MKVTNAYDKGRKFREEDYLQEVFVEQRGNAKVVLSMNLITETKDANHNEYERYSLR